MYGVRVRARLRQRDPDSAPGPAPARRNSWSAPRSARRASPSPHGDALGPGLPQYGVGHHERVARVRGAAARLPGLALRGAAYEGAGVAAFVATGRGAARQLLAA